MSKSGKFLTSKQIIHYNLFLNNATMLSVSYSVGSEFHFFFLLLCS